MSKQKTKPGAVHSFLNKTTGKVIHAGTVMTKAEIDGLPKGHADKYVGEVGVKGTTNDED